MESFCTDKEVLYFIKESNAIENIFRDPTDAEFDEFIRFVHLSKMTIENLIYFVSIYQPDAKLRDQYNMNVRVNRYYPPFGGPEITSSLQELLDRNLDAYYLHIGYEQLHPFMDCNGRSGRALWAWKMKDIKDGFLKPFYFQTLNQLNSIRIHS